MRDLRESCRIAVVQAAPVMFDKAACTVKAVELIRARLRAGGADRVPGLFIPGYPYGMTFGFTVGGRTAPGRKDWGLYYDNSILVPGPETRSWAGPPGSSGLREYRRVRAGRRQRHAVQYQPDLFPRRANCSPSTGS